MRSSISEDNIEQAICNRLSLPEYEWKRNFKQRVQVAQWQYCHNTWHYYSDQVVDVKNPQRVGTYSYANKGGMPMTVPVIDGDINE